MEKILINDIVIVGDKIVQYVGNSICVGVLASIIEKLKLTK